jgi:hypothetical protein
MRTKIMRFKINTHKSSMQLSICFEIEFKKIGQ